MRSLRLTPEARADIAAIGRYSRKTWGVARGRSYSTALAGRIMKLRTRPSLGSRRPDIDPDVRVLRAGRHIILYDVAPDAIVVLRILHERMNVAEISTKLDRLRSGVRAPRPARPRRSRGG